MPDSLAQILTRLLAKKPDSRYQKPTELLYDLEAPERASGKARPEDEIPDFFQGMAPAAAVPAPPPTGEISDSVTSAGTPVARPRPSTEKSCVTTLFRIALVVFLVSAIVSFAAGFQAAVRGPAKLP